MMKHVRKCLVGAAVMALAFTTVPATDTIDFEGLARGEILTQVFGAGGAGPVGVSGVNPACGAGTNAAVVFDTTNPASDDDLGSPNETCPEPGPGVGLAGQFGEPNENCVPRGNVLIVHEQCGDLVSSPVANPDDADLEGALLEFDFSALGTVTIHDLVLMDVEAEEPNAEVRLFDELDVLIAMIVLEPTGDNGVVVEPIERDGVARMELVLNGSGSIDNIVFTPDDDPVCGDGEVNAPGETCDPPGEPAGEPNECRDDCTFCGDGVLDFGEQCDDGNNIDGDGCSAFCDIEMMGEGCTPGYWRQDQHYDSWVGYMPGDLFDAVFGVDAPGDDTLGEAVVSRGGGENALQRHAVAALLNASSPDVAYAYTVAEVIVVVQGAYASGDFESAKDMLEAENGDDTYCPLD